MIPNVERCIWVYSVLYQEVFLLKTDEVWYGNGKVNPLQALCGPEGG